MPAGSFLLLGQEGDEYEAGKEPLQDFSSKVFILHVDHKEFKPCPSGFSLMSLGHATLLMTISQIWQK